MSSLLCIPGTFSTPGQAYCDNCAPAGTHMQATPVACRVHPVIFVLVGRCLRSPRVRTTLRLATSVCSTPTRGCPPDAISSRQKCPMGHGLTISGFWTQVVTHWCWRGARTVPAECSVAWARRLARIVLLANTAAVAGPRADLRPFKLLSWWHRRIRCSPGFF